MMRSKLKIISPMVVILLAINSVPAHGDNEVKESGTLMATLSGQSLFIIKGSKNLSGEAQILSRQGENISIAYKKTARTSSEKESKRFLDLIDFKLTVDDDQATFSILSPSQAPWEGSNYSVNIGIVIELPEKMEIQGSTNFMKLDIDGPFQGVELSSTFSNMDIQRIYGPVTVKTNSGEIKLSAIKGEVEIDTQNGGITADDIYIQSGYAVLKTTHSPITLSNISGPVEAYTSFAGIWVRDIESPNGSVVLNTSYGSIEVDEMTGELICETSYAPITVTNSTINHGYSRIETSHAPINADIAKIDRCELYIANEYSNIDLGLPDNISTKLIAGVGRGGRIYVSGLDLRPTVLENTRLEAIVDEGESRVELNVSGIGNINISGR